MIRKKIIAIALLTMILLAFASTPCAAEEGDAVVPTPTDAVIPQETSTPESTEIISDLGLLSGEDNDSAESEETTEPQNDLEFRPDEDTGSPENEDGSENFNIDDLTAFAIDLIMFLIVCVLIGHLIKKINSIAKTVDSIRTNREMVMNQTGQAEGKFSDRKKSEIIGIVLQSEEFKEYIREQLQKNHQMLRPKEIEPKITKLAGSVGTLEREPEEAKEAKKPIKLVKKKRICAILKEYGANNSVNIQTIKTDNEEDAADLFLYEAKEGFSADINKKKYPRISKLIYKKIHFDMLYDVKFPDNKDDDYEYDYNISENDCAVCKNEKNYAEDILAVAKKGTIEILDK